MGFSTENINNLWHWEQAEAIFKKSGWNKPITELLANRKLSFALHRNIFRLGFIDVLSSLDTYHVKSTSSNTPRIFHVETTWNTRGVFKYLNGQKIIYQALRIFFSNKLHGNSWYISWGSVWWIRTWTLTLHTLVLKACLS